MSSGSVPGAELADVDREIVLTLGTPCPAYEA